MTVALLIAAGWSALAVLLAVLLGRVLRRNGQHPTPPSDRP